MFIVTSAGVIATDPIAYGFPETVPAYMTEIKEGSAGGQVLGTGGKGTPAAEVRRSARLPGRPAVRPQALLRAVGPRQLTKAKGESRKSFQARNPAIAGSLVGARESSAISHHWSLSSKHSVPVSLLLQYGAIVFPCSCG